LDLHGAELTGACENNVHIALLADGLTIGGNILLRDNFTAQGEVRLDGSKIQGNLDCTGAQLTNKNGFSLSADATEVTGNVYLQAGHRAFTSIGIVSFEVAKITGDLDCSGGHFTAMAFAEKESAREEPDIYAVAEKQLTQEEHQDVYAIIAHNLKVGADIKFMKKETKNRGKMRFIAEGVVALLNAQVGGDVRCEGALFKFPGEVALWADGIVVSATLYLDFAETDGILQFAQAELKLGLSAEQVTFDASQQYRGLFGDTSRVKFDLGERACGIYAPDSAISGVFLWRKIEKKISRDGAHNPCWLNLSGAKLDVVRDDQNSWEELDRFNITDCTYERLSSEKPSEEKLSGKKMRFDNVAWRLVQLDREYAILNGSRLHNLVLAWRVFWRALLVRIPLGPRELLGLTAANADIPKAGTRFEPQPYVQFSRMLWTDGHHAAAKSVRVHLERNRTRYSSYGVWRQLWQWILDATLRYGYSPFRPVLILGGWALICAFLFEIAFEHRKLVSIRDLQAVSQTQKESIPESPKVAFNPVIYAIDTLVPIVDLNQKRNWIVNPLSSRPHSPDDRAGWRGVWDSRPHATGILIVFNTFFGWLMTTLFAAGITGLLRTEE